MDANAAVKSTGSQSVPQAKSNSAQRVQSLQLPAAEAMPRSGRRWLLGLIVLAVLGVGGYFGYRVLLVPEKEVVQASTAATNDAAPPRNDSATASPAGANSSNFNSAPSPVSSSVASSGEIAHESKGFIIPAHQILVSPKVPGMMTMLKIEEGQRVKKDDMLAQLETTDYDADYQRAKAAAASIAQKKLELENGSRRKKSRIPSGNARSRSAAKPVFRRMAAYYAVAKKRRSHAKRIRFGRGEFQSQRSARGTAAKSVRSDGHRPAAMNALTRPALISSWPRPNWPKLNGGLITARSKPLLRHDPHQKGGRRKHR